MLTSCLVLVGAAQGSLMQAKILSHKELLVPVQADRRQTQLSSSSGQIKPAHRLRAKFWRSSGVHCAFQ